MPIHFPLEVCHSIVFSIFTYTKIMQPSPQSNYRTFSPPPKETHTHCPALDAYKE